MEDKNKEINITSLRIKQAMAAKGMKQVDLMEKCQELGEKYGVKFGKSGLSQWVNGLYKPSGKKLTILSMALGVPEVWLMGFNDIPDEMETRVDVSMKTDKELRKMVKQFLLLPNDRQEMLKTLVSDISKATQL